MKNLTCILDVERDFSWGPVVRTILVGSVLVIVFHEQIFKDGCGTNHYQTKKETSHAYIWDAGRWRDTNHSYATPEEAVIGGMAILHDGLNTQADRYFLCSIGYARKA